jgi:hypothetical protein
MFVRKISREGGELIFLVSVVLQEEDVGAR